MKSVPSRECRQLRQHLPEYADGSLTGPQRARVEDHVGRCPRCAAEVEDLRAITDAVRAIPPDEVPEDLLPRLQRSLRERPPAPAGLPRLWPRIAVPVALAVGLAAVALVLRTPPQYDRQAARGVHGDIAESTDAVRAPAPSDSRPSADADSVRIAQASEEAMARRLGLDEAAREEPTPALPLRDMPLPDNGSALAAPPALLAPSAETAPPSSGASKLHAPARGGGVAGGAARGAAALPAQPPARPVFGPRGEVPPVRGVGRRSAPMRFREGKVRRQAGPALEAAGALETEDLHAPPFSAKASLLREQGQPAIALELGAETPTRELSVYVGGNETRRLLWQGPSEAAARLALGREQIGPGPAAIPIALQSDAQTRNYVLFVPTLARLGEAAPTAPCGCYRNRPLSDILAEISALTGIVVLAEEPLSQVLQGEIPSGPPQAALQHAAQKAGLEVEETEGVVFNLRHPR